MFGVTLASVLLYMHRIAHILLLIQLFNPKFEISLGFSYSSMYSGSMIFCMF